MGCLLSVGIANLQHVATVCVLPSLRKSVVRLVLVC